MVLRGRYFCGPRGRGPSHGTLWEGHSPLCPILLRRAETPSLPTCRGSQGHWPIGSRYRFGTGPGACLSLRTVRTRSLPRDLVGGAQCSMPDIFPDRGGAVPPGQANAAGCLRFGNRAGGARSGVAPVLCGVHGAPLLRPFGGPGISRGLAWDRVCRARGAGRVCTVWPGRPDGTALQGRAMARARRGRALSRPWWGGVGVPWCGCSRVALYPTACTRFSGRSPRRMGSEVRGGPEAFPADVSWFKLGA